MYANEIYPDLNQVPEFIYKGDIPLKYIIK